MLTDVTNFFNAHASDIAAAELEVAKAEELIGGRMQWLATSAHADACNALANDLATGV